MAAAGAMEIPRLLGHVKGAVSAWCHGSLKLSLSPSLPIHTWEPSQTGYENPGPTEMSDVALPPTVPPKVPRLASTTGTVTGPPVQPATAQRTLNRVEVSYSPQTLSELLIYKQNKYCY